MIYVLMTFVNGLLYVHTLKKSLPRLREKIFLAPQNAPL